MDRFFQLLLDSHILKFIIPILGVYGIAIALQIFGLYKKSRKHFQDDDNAAQDTLPNVSVIIPFRNEAHNLYALLESLIKQNYSGQTEVVLVNDNSDDEWRSIVDKFVNGCDNAKVKIRVADKPHDDSLNLTSKQQALDFGVNLASHSVLLFTDADMILSDNWIKILVDSHLTSNADLVFGHTSITPNTKKSNVSKKSTVLSVMEAYQLEYLFAFAYTFSKLELTGSCMGNNLLITKSAYNQIGGQRGIGYTIVEDKALLQVMRKRKMKICATTPFTPTAKTYPSQSVKQFYNQIMRWARGGFRPGGGLFLAGTLLLVQNFCVMLSPFYITSPISIIALTNFLLTWIFLSLAFHKNRAPVNKLLFPLHFVFLMCEFFVVAITLPFVRKVEWKKKLYK